MKSPLSETHPDVALEWHSVKNGTLTLPKLLRLGRGRVERAPDQARPERFRAAGYTLANVGAGVALATGPWTVHLDVALRNAFNKKYQSFLSRYKLAADPVVLDPGRNLTVRVSTDF